MKNTGIQRLLDQVESLHTIEKHIAGFISQLYSAQPNEVGPSIGTSREASENRTHLGRLEGLIAILTLNIARDMTTQEAEKTIAYCNDLLHRFNSKHALIKYDYLMKSAVVLGRNDIIQLLHESQSNGSSRLASAA